MPARSCILNCGHTKIINDHLACQSCRCISLWQESATCSSRSANECVCKYGRAGTLRLAAGRLVALREPSIRGRGVEWRRTTGQKQVARQCTTKSRSRPFEKTWVGLLQSSQQTRPLPKSYRANSWGLNSQHAVVLYQC